MRRKNELEAGDVVQWVKPLKTGYWGINKVRTRRWPKVGDIDVIVKYVDYDDFQLANLLCAGDLIPWWVGNEEEHFRKLGKL